MAGQRIYEYLFTKVNENGEEESIVVTAKSKAEAVNIAKEYDSKFVYDFML